MNENILLIVLMTFLSTGVQSQNFLVDNKIELGVRSSTSIQSFSIFLSANARMQLEVGTVEAIISPWSDRFVITGLYAAHDSDFLKNQYSGALEGFSYFFGLGGHLGASYSDFLSGVDVQAGIEYKIPDLPLKVSTDLKPAYHITGPAGINKLEFQGGASIRYVF